MKLDKLALGLMAMGMMSYNRLSVYPETQFNLRRDNDKDALERANKKIALAQEENRKRKESRKELRRKQ
jgi:hypothetical protein